MISFTVPGEPRGKGRPRATIRGQHAGVYTDAKTASYENLIRLAAKAAMGAQAPLEGSLSLMVMILMQPPASASKRRRAGMLSGEIRPTKRPDTNNVVAAAQDGMNQVVYRDDAQIVMLHASKRYSTTPGLEITVAPL
jgi:Holliday junction resolvase RusA-like endonuclease